MRQIQPRTRHLGASLFLTTALAGALMLLPVQRGYAAECVGDCDGDGEVGINELIMMVNIALGNMDLSMCDMDTNGDGEIGIAELVSGTISSLDGCATVGPTPTPTMGSCGETFDSTFEAIQTVIFERHSCNSQLCHSATIKQGGLDLSPENAYANIFEKQATGKAMPLIQPGDKDRSYLWLKLAASTDPSLLPPGFMIVGAPMPNGLPALSADELEALRLWIYGGAPETGTVPGTDALLNACLPTPAPILIAPLDPPAEGKGIQLTMPEWPLEAQSEHEICFASYYDVTDQVPEEYRDPSGTSFRFSEMELRQDPQSHHLILNRYIGPASDINDPSFGEWTCAGGERAGETCEPTDRSSCGSGLCRSEIRQSFACIGFGPSTGGPLGRYSIGGAQAAQSHNKYHEGVFAQIPMKGILYWNSHAFNLTNEDTTMHGWLNYYFSDDQRYPLRGIFDASRIFAPNAAPFTKQTVCNDHVLPQGARLFNLSSHTHKHGQHFTITMPDGSMIYENFIYNDPADITFDPPIAFDSPDPAQRTLHYCSLYNNGLRDDGSFDTDLVTRHSRVPSSAQNSIGNCNPVACVSGKVGAPCNGVGDDRVCDSSAGANDGFCDACNITGGESTQNEMFILIGSYFCPNGCNGNDPY